MCSAPDFGISPHACSQPVLRGQSNEDGVMKRALLATIAAATLAGCGTANLAGADLPRGASAYSALGAPATISAQPQPRDYRIGPLDTVSVTVYQEPSMSVGAVQVDAAGNVSLPLIGSIPASGLTASELSGRIAKRLSTRYLHDPQVTVAVTGSVSQRVVVQGEVNQAGVYDVRGRTTLLEALALARGETRVASLREVVVFRNVNGQRMGALFDVDKIRRGEAADPEILGNDVVVVGHSQRRALWRDILQAAPLLGVFQFLSPAG
jgi:polysaccharide export outer membrane protein